MNYYKFLPLCLAACASTQSAIPEGLDGYWMSDGYGLVAEIRDRRVRSYQFAGGVCVPEDGEWERLSSILDSMDIALAADGETAFITPKFAQHRMRVNRIDALPAACLTPPENTAEGNFDAFVSFFADNYAFFDLYGVDWSANVSAARSRIRPDMSDTDLFNVMAGLMAPLRDGHLALNGMDGRQNLTYKPNPGRTHRLLMARAAQSGRDREDIVDAFHEAFWIGNVRDGILAGEGRFDGNRRVQYGVADGDIGYLALVTVAGYSGRRPDPERDLQEINRMMEEALQHFRQEGVQAVIVDLSANYGGFDFVSRAIAERFAAQPTHAYTKYAGDADAPIRSRVMLHPSTGTRFEGPVYVVTSNITISGGEVLTLALRSLPNVTHVGEATRGALSDVLDRTLPNGWELSLSNEVYLDSDGIAWEGRGILPERRLNIFPDSNPVAGHLRAIKQLIEEI